MVIGQRSFGTVKGTPGRYGCPRSGNDTVIYPVTGLQPVQLPEIETLPPGFKHFDYIVFSDE